MFMLNSAEHEILNVHKYKKYHEIQLLSGTDKPRTQFFPFLKIQNYANNCWHFNIYEQEKNHFHMS